jgi:hypothetical protein
MSEIIEIRDLETDYEQTIATSLVENGFAHFRVNPQLMNEGRFRPQLPGKKPLLSHFFQPPTGSKLDDIPELMQERILREPKDIREVIALGKTITENKCEFVIYAPQITGESRKLLKIARWPNWTGLGLTISSFDPEDENLWDLTLVGFSDP